MKMKELIQKTGMTRRNIHFYIQEGLLSPVSSEPNGYYDFSEEDCKKLEFIRQMRNAGLSLQAIRSILTYPVTVNFYMNRQIKKLKKELRHLEQTLVSLQYILDDLPFYPDFGSIYEVVHEAGIPEPETTDTQAEIDRYSSAIINRFLWGGFLPEGKWTEYQKYLWMKINRITAESPSDAYLTIAHTLNSMESRQINELYDTNVDRYREIAALTEDQIPNAADDMICRLKEIAKNPNYIRTWKNTYESFFAPNASIQASELSFLVMEMSPFYKQYVENILEVCRRVYEYLISDEGHSLHENLISAFGDHLDLSASNHGQLEAILNVPHLYHQLRNTDPHA